MFALLAKNNSRDHQYFSPPFVGNIGEWKSLIFLSNQKDGHSLRGKHTKQTVVRLNTLARQIKDHHSCFSKSNTESHDQEIMRFVMTGCRCIDGSYFYTVSVTKVRRNMRNFFVLFPTAAVSSYFFPGAKQVWVMLATVYCLLLPRS